MKAVMKTKPGPGLEIKEIAKPSLPKNFPEGEVIVKVGACGICGTDLGIYDWTPWIAQSMQIPMTLGICIDWAIHGVQSQILESTIGHHG